MFDILYNNLKLSWLKILEFYFAVKGKTIITQNKTRNELVLKPIAPVIKSNCIYIHTKLDSNLQKLILKIYSRKTE